MGCGREDNTRCLYFEVDVVVWPQANILCRGISFLCAYSYEYNIDSDSVTDAVGYTSRPERGFGDRKTYVGTSNKANNNKKN